MYLITVSFECSQQAGKPKSTVCVQLILLLLLLLLLFFHSSFKSHIQLCAIECTYVCVCVCVCVCVGTLNRADAGCLSALQCTGMLFLLSVYLHFTSLCFASTHRRTACMYVIRARQTPSHHRQMDLNENNSQLVGS